MTKLEHLGKRDVIDFSLQIHSIDWFSHVHHALPQDERFTKVYSWKEAADWCSNPMSWWCNVEGKNSLSIPLCNKHYDIYTGWNSVAEACLDFAKHTLDKYVMKKIPSLHCTDDVHDWIQSLIISALMECYYADYVCVKLFREQMYYFSLGHFACGWTLASPGDFPLHSKIIVF